MLLHSFNCQVRSRIDVESVILNYLHLIFFFTYGIRIFSSRCSNVEASKQDTHSNSFGHVLRDGHLGEVRAMC